MEKNQLPAIPTVHTVASQLTQLRDTERRAQLQALLPLIDNLIGQGVSHAKIVETLTASALPISLVGLRQALYRWRNRHKRVAESRIFNPISPPSLPSQSQAMPAATTGDIATKADLVRLRQSSDHIDLTELANYGRKK